MTTQEAKQLGYTVPLTASTYHGDTDLFAQPGADYDSAFDAFCPDLGEVIRVHGWLVDITEA